ncbi:ABC transporter substrate-binding protein [Paenibacillus alkalitolerans]|uniref:ABC transporter substrate-binding protein n=1 Tax=Paenibacillus alkalitolerans TaxID=2799335 RepID=UPI0018F302B0|nr:extracellular solute-binding protein [Paenibacillus alkalitolerans]
MNLQVVKRWMLLLLCFAFAFGLAACSSNQGAANEPGEQNSGETASNGSSESANPNPVKLRIMWWGSQSRHDATLKALELYTQKNPHVTFEPEFSGWEGYWDKLSTQAAAKNAPDIIQMDAAYLAEYASRKQLADITEGIDTSGMDAALLNTGKYNDSLYAIALGNNAFGLAYNKEMIEKLGLPLPKDGWTWEQYFQYGRDIKAKLGPEGHALMDHTGALDIYGIYQMSHGKGYYVTPDGKFNIDKQLWLEWVNTFSQLREEGVVPPADAAVTDKELDPALDLLNNGKVAIRQLHAAQSGALDSMKPGAYAMVTMPNGPEGAGWLKPSMFWSVSSDSKHVEEAKKFINWFINDIEAAEILGTTRGVPVSKDVLGHLEPKFNEADRMGISLIQNTSSIAQPFQADPKGWSNFRAKDYVTIAEKIQFGQLTPEQAWEEIVAMAQDYQ